MSLCLTEKEVDEERKHCPESMYNMSCVDCSDHNFPCKINNLSSISWMQLRKFWRVSKIVER